ARASRRHRLWSALARSLRRGRVRGLPARSDLGPPGPGIDGLSSRSREPQPHDPARYRGRAGGGGNPRLDHLSRGRTRLATGIRERLIELRREKWRKRIVDEHLVRALSIYEARGQDAHRSLAA